MDSKKRHFEMSNAIQRMKEILIRKGVKTEWEVSSQENVLFAIVEWISLEDLHQLFPPLVFNGTETRKEKHVRYDQRRREKQNAAFSSMKEFIIGEGIGKWNKQTLSRNEILEVVLQFIENDSASVLPVPPKNTKALPTGSKSLVDPQMAIQTPITPLLKHSVDSILGDPRQSNSSSYSEQLLICSKTMKARTSYSAVYRTKWQREQRSELSNIIEKMKEVLITRGLNTASEVSLQENVLFAVVQWICSEDLNLLFSPLVFNGTETREEWNAQKSQRRIEKHNAAFSRMKEFIIGGGIGEWKKRPLSRKVILETILQFIRNKPSNSCALPVPPINMNCLPTGSESPVIPQMAIQPPVLKHSVESMLKNPNLINANKPNIFDQPINEIEPQSYISNLTMLNIFIRNQMLSPVENKANEKGPGSFVSGTSNMF